MSADAEVQRLLDQILDLPDDAQAVLLAALIETRVDDASLDRIDDDQRALLAIHR